MKILHVIPSIGSLSGGPVRALMGYVNCVKGHTEVEIATTQAGTSWNFLSKFQESVGNVRIHYFPQVGSHSHNFSWPLSQWLKRNVGGYDLLHIHALFSPLSSIAAFLARRAKVPYVIRPLGTLSQYTFVSRNRLIKELYFRLIERRTIKGGAAMHFTTDSEREKAQAICDVPNPVVIPIPIGLPAENGRSSDPRSPEKNILFLSRLHPKKGLELLIESARGLLLKHPEVQLLVAGEGKKDYVRKLKQRVSEAGVDHKVHFLGFVEGEAKEKLFRRAAVFALPSQDENFGVAAAEAMAAGLPVVVSNQVGIASEIEEYGAGIVVKCEVSSVEAALENLISNSVLCLEMGKRGRRLVQERYHPERIGRELLNIYSQVVAHC